MRSFLEKSLIVLCAILLGLGILEMLIRIGWIGSKPQFGFTKASSIPGLYFSHRPNHKEKGLFPKRIIPLKGKTLIDHEEAFYTFNSWGYRDSEFSKESLANKTVILCLGDSTTMGTYAKDQETYPQQLERMLQKSWNKNTEVINAGVGGYNLWQYRAHLNFLLTQVKPKIVIVGLCLNDHVPSQKSIRWRSLLENHSLIAYNIFRRLPRAQRDTSPLSLKDRLLKILDEDSAETILRLEKGMRTDGQVTARVEAINLPSLWRQALENLSEMRRLCEARGIRFFCVIFPEQFQLVSGYRHPEPQKTIARFLRQNGIDFCDMRPVFRGAQRKGAACYVYPTDFSHFNSFGHFLTASSLYDLLTKKAMAGK